MSIPTQQIPPANTNVHRDLYSSMNDHEYLKHRYGDSWATCNQAAERLTKETCNHWKEEVEKLLIFAGLFSAIITAFAVEAVLATKDDPAKTNTILLQTVVLQLHNISNPQGNPPTVAINPTETSVPGSTHRVLLFHALSLTISLISVVIGILCLQWLREFGRDVTGVSHRDDLILQYHRNESLRRWGVIAILNSLPLLLIISVMLFFAGFLETLWESRSIAAIPVTILVGLALLFIIITSMLPTLQLLAMHTPWLGRLAVCPYRSPQAWVFYSTIGPFFSLFQRFKFLGNIKTWVDYDSWCSRNEDSVLSALFWVGEAHRQDPRVVSAVYSSVRLPIQEAVKNSVRFEVSGYGLESQILFEDHLTAVREGLANFEVESSFSTDDIRIRTFIALYADKDTDGRYLVDVDVRAAVNGLLPHRIRAGIPIDTAIAYLEVVQDMAHKHIIDGRILKVARAVITGAWTYTHQRSQDVPRSFVTAFNNTLKALHEAAIYIEESNDYDLTSPPLDSVLTNHPNGHQLLHLIYEFRQEPFYPATGFTSMDMQLGILLTLYRGIDTSDTTAIQEFVNSMPDHFDEKIPLDTTIAFFGVVQNMAEHHIIHERVLIATRRMVTQMSEYEKQKVGPTFFNALKNTLKALRNEAKYLRGDLNPEGGLKLHVLERFHDRTIDTLSQNSKFVETLLRVIISLYKRPSWNIDVAERDILHDMIPPRIYSTISIDTIVIFLRMIQDSVQTHTIHIRLLDAVTHILTEVSLSLSLEQYIIRRLLRSLRNMYYSLLEEVFYLQNSREAEELEAIHRLLTSALNLLNRFPVTENSEIVKSFKIALMDTLDRSFRLKPVDTSSVVNTSEPPTPSAKPDQTMVIANDTLGEGEQIRDEGADEVAVPQNNSKDKVIESTDLKVIEDDINTFDALGGFSMYLLDDSTE